MRKILKTALTLAGIAGVATMLPAAILAAAGPGQSARVYFYRMPNPADLPVGLSIESWSGRTAVLSGVDAVASRALYAQGALLVFPVRAGGCLALGT